MGSHRRLPFAFVFVLLISASALAQGPAFGIGRTPSPEEIKARDISIGPTGEELPPGKGTAKEGAQLYRTKGCAACHGATGLEGTAPNLKSKDPKNPDVWARGRILPLRAPFATTVWDFINRAMPLEGGLYQWAKLGFNELTGFMVAWNLWLFAILNTSEIGLQITQYVHYVLGPRT